MSEPIDVSKLPPMIRPGPMDAVNYTTHLMIALLTMVEARGLFTRAEFGDHLAGNLDPNSSSPFEQLLVVFANCMQRSEGVFEEISAQMQHPHLRLVDPADE